MTKSFDSESLSGTSISNETKEKLLALMDKQGVSLIRASQLLKIPYKVAK